MKNELWYDYLWCGVSLSDLIDKGVMSEMVLRQKNLDDYEGMMMQVLARIQCPKEAL